MVLPKTIWHIYSVVISLLLIFPCCFIMYCGRRITILYISTTIFCCHPFLILLSLTWLDEQAPIVLRVKTISPFIFMIYCHRAFISQLHLLWDFDSYVISPWLFLFSQFCSIIQNSFFACRYQQSNFILNWADTCISGSCFAFFTYLLSFHEP